MNKKIISILGITIFIVTFGLSILLESPILLYIASATPLFVVPFLPDIRTNQIVSPKKNNGQFDIFRVTGNQGAPSDLLVISFQPGAVYWNKRNLYFSLEGVPVKSTLESTEFTAAITALQYDLRLDRVTKNQVGLHLLQLAERVQNLPYTLNEVNRIIIRVGDIMEQYAPTSTAAQSEKVNMHA